MDRNAPFGGVGPSLSDWGAAAGELLRQGKLHPPRPLTAVELAEQEKLDRRGKLVLRTVMLGLIFPPAGLAVLIYMLLIKRMVPRGLIWRLVLLLLLLPATAYFWFSSITELQRGRLIEVPVALLIAVASSRGVAVLSSIVRQPGVHRLPARRPVPPPASPSGPR